MRQQITSAITVVLQLNRLTDGTRRLVSLQEITGMEGDIITMQEIFGLRRLGVGSDGKVKTQFFATGICPHFDHRLKEFGVGLPDAIYDPNQVFG
jgi:pilus assembly protein CpaF